MKRLGAVIAAAVITGLVALCMLLIGLNALLNPNSVRASDVATSAVANTPGVGVDPAQTTQLRNLIAQYQDREKQYQAQLDQANTQIHQYQQVMAELQQRGVIRITNDGQILVPSGLSGGGDGE
jgi:uncharacterized protein HemX